MKKFDIHRWWIPGKSMSVVFVPLGIWTFIYFVSSMVRYSNRFDIYFSRLGWDWRSGYKVIIDPSIKMEPFNYIMRGCFAGYWIVLLVCLILIAERYLWLRRDRSLYIMKRIPASETFRRCAMLLVIYAVLVLILTIILIYVFKANYMAKVPEVCLEPQDPVNVFGAFSLKDWFRYVR